MPTVDEQQKMISEGRDAKALKNNPALEACMDETLTRLFMEWVSTGPDQFAERDSIHATANALKEFKNTIDAFITTGALEERNRDDEKSNNFE